MTMRTGEPPKNQTMLDVSEKHSAEEAAATTPQTTDLSNLEDQLGAKDKSIAETSPEKVDAIRNESAPATPEYPKAWKLFVIVAGLCLAVFLVALDQTIVAVAVPKITDHFHSLDDVGWCVHHERTHLDWLLMSSGMALHTCSPEPHCSPALEGFMLNLMYVGRIQLCSTHAETS
jgi:hypothetical protein